MSVLNELKALDKRKPFTTRIEGVSQELVIHPPNALASMEFTCAKVRGDSRGMLELLVSSVKTIDGKPVFKDVSEAAQLDFDTAKNLFDKIDELYPEAAPSIDSKKDSSAATSITSPSSASPVNGENTGETLVSA